MITTVVKQKVTTLLVTALSILGLFTFVFSATPVLATNNGCETDTALIKCTGVDGSGKLQSSGLWSILILAIQILTAGVGVVALAGIVYGIILYTTSAGDPGKAKKAFEVLRNVIIGVVAYALMWSALNWLIPGGIFNP